MFLFLSACGYRIVPVDLVEQIPIIHGPRPGMGYGGTDWGAGAFTSNGERLIATYIEEVVP